MENSHEKKQITEKYFLDTNVLAYLASTEEPKKHEKAKALIKNNIICISTQNLRELANILLKKTSLSPEEISKIILTFAKTFTIFIELPTDILDATRLCNNRKNFYDTLLVTTMQRNNITTIITENEKDFKEFKGIKVINPFK